LRNEVDFLLALILDALTASVGVDRNFGEMRNTSQNSIVGRARTENRPIVAGSGGKVRFYFNNVRQQAV
jgi:hypothetical protein